jgi:hypothetical protein
MTAAGSHVPATLAAFTVKVRVVTSLFGPCT